MAVRIIDNSALLDINALSGRDSDFGDDPPRWLWPGELDLESGLELIRSNANLAVGDDTNLSAENILNLAEPQGRSFNGAMGENTFNERLYDWLQTSAQNTRDEDLEVWEVLGSGIEKQEVEDPMSTVLTTVTADLTVDPNIAYTTYGVRQEETELRWRNGLNRANSDNSASEPPTPLETVDNAFFRSPTGAAVEAAFIDTPFTNARDFLQDEPRKQITTASGSADYARFDVNELTRVRDREDENLNNTTDLDDLAEVFEESLEGTAPPALVTRGGWASAEDFANQAAALLRDFADEDSLLTRRGSTFGMEYLPFISEVYIQARYIPQAAVSPGIANPMGDDLPWQVQADDYVVIIELVNPWPWVIELPDVDMVMVDGADETSIGELPAMATAASAAQSLLPNETIFVRMEGTMASADNTNLTLAGTPTEFEPTIAMPWPEDNNARVTLDSIENVSIHMQAMANDGNRVTYQIFNTKKIPDLMVESYEMGEADPVVTSNTEGYLQLSSLGSADGLDALAVRAIDVADQGWADDPEFAMLSDNVVQPGNALALNSGAAAANRAAMLGIAKKGATSADSAVGDMLDDRVTGAREVSPAGMPLTPVNAEPWVIGNAGQLYRSGDVLRMVLLGPRDTNSNGLIETVAQVWHNTFFTNEGRFSIADMMLDVDDTSQTVGDTGLSFAAYYLTAFETLQINGNSDRGRVPGRPNINTMSPDLLSAILPTTDTMASDALATFIAAARDTPAMLGRPADERGIKFLAELLNATTASDRELIYGPDAADSILDTNELDPHVGFNEEDAFEDDLEEQGLMLNYLNQVVSTRSDVFTVYVLVRSYPADDFSGPDPVDEFRLMAVFDRSRTNQNGFPRLLAVRKLDE